MSVRADKRGVVWVAVGTHHFKEAQAVQNLERQGFQAYCPMIRKKVRHARRLREVLRPLFPGYVFVSLDAEHDQWRPILSTIGVRTLIRFGDRLGILPRSFVESLRSLEDEGAIPLPCAKDSYASGERVRLREGPFEGVIATVLRCDDNGRLTLLMDMLSRSVSVKAGLEQVVPA